MKSLRLCLAPFGKSTVSRGERYITAALGHRSGVHMPSLISLRYAQRVSAVL